LSQSSQSRGTPLQAPQASALPRHLLYATSARIGGSGLDSVAHQSLIGAHRAGILECAVAYDNRQKEVPSSKIRSLRWHPVRLLSSLQREYYYGAKKHYVDWIAARELRSGKYDCFHGWSGDSLRSLRVAKQRRIPSLIEIPTWHRNKGKVKPPITKAERATQEAGFPSRLLVSRQHALEEYELADLLLVLSEKAVETFLAAGIEPEKLYKLERGVDVNRFRPGKRPSIFRAIFVGALIERKGVHLLLEVWHKLALKDAELVLVGSVHDEIRPWLEKFGGHNVRVVGFARDVERYYQEASLQIFPSLCEGSAKATYEAAACGLAQITTRESGDVVVDGVNGIVIPADNPDALADAIRHLYGNPELLEKMGAAGRKRVAENYTWDHFRARLLDAYRVALGRVG
jgi:glycosyltransferase involved in cell wall biosynthesis